MFLLPSFITNWFAEDTIEADPLSKRQKHLVCEQIRSNNVPSLRSIPKAGLRERLKKMKRVPKKWTSRSGQ